MTRNTTATPNITNPERASHPPSRPWAADSLTECVITE